MENLEVSDTLVNAFYPKIRGGEKRLQLLSQQCSMPFPCKERKIPQIVVKAGEVDFVLKLVILQYMLGCDFLISRV